MKHLILLLFLALFVNGKAQDKKITTTTLTVKGNCLDCKKRIENAADIKGVKLFEWNDKTQVAKVIFDNSKTSLETIEKAIAARGYDTQTQKGNEAAYSKLPKCCQYRHGVCEEKK